MLSGMIKRAPTSFLGRLDELRDRRHGPIPHRPVLGLSPPLPPISEQIPWTKARFTSFVEDVKKSYTNGQIVTLKHCIVQEGMLPVIMYKISYISELYHNTNFDNHLHEPILLTLQPLDGSTRVNRCASQVRALTEEELSLVNLRNTEVKGTA